VYGGLTQGNESIFEIAEAPLNWDYYRVAEVQEKYTKAADEDLDKQLEEWKLGDVQERDQP